MKRYCEKCKKETEWKECFLLDLHNEYFHIREVTDKVTGADVQNEVTLVCE